MDADSTDGAQGGREADTEAHSIPLSSRPEGPPSRIATLPPELLGDVFLWSKRGHKKHPIPTAWIRATQVCHYWREVALNTLLLWRTLDFTPRMMRQTSYLPFLREMLRRSGQMPLCLDFGEVYSDQTELIALILSELHRLEEFSIDFDRYSGHIPEGVSDAPILRSLRFHSVGNSRKDPPIPFVSPEFPLKFLESIHFMRYRYSYLSRFFRPTMKHLSLDRCGGGSVVDFLHALGGMPLLETVEVYSDSYVASRLATSELPTIKLYFLRRLNLNSDHILSCAQILDRLSFPATALLNISLTGHEVSEETRFNAAIASKAAGHGLLGTVVNPVHTLRIWAIVGRPNFHPTIDMWRDDASFHAADESRVTPIPSTEPFCQYSHLYRRTASEALEQLCSAALHDVGSIRTLVISDNDGDPTWYTMPIAKHFWSDSLRALVGLESLYLKGVVWDGLGSQLDPASVTVNPGMTSTELPFPRLRLLALTRICFRLRSLDDVEHQDSPADFIYALQGMLRARKNAGIGLDKLIISNPVNFDEEDLAMLEACVEEVEWEELSDTDTDDES